MEFEIQEVGEQKVLVLKGGLTIESTAALKATLVKFIEKSEDIIIDMSKVADADITCLQLLCAANKTAQNTQKTLSLRGADSKVFKDLLHDAGYGLENCVTSIVA